MIYTAADIAAATGARIHGLHQLPLRHLLTDSRRLVHPRETVFFALRSSRRDAAQYIPELYEAGVRCFVATQIPEGHFQDACFLIVSDPLKALQQLASEHRSKFSYPVVGITGSNGKTVVKEWLFQLLRDRFEIVRSPRSYNSQTGVPLSVWPMNEQHTLAIFEAGISQPGEMEKLEHIIRPQIGILTNIGTAHDENFSSTDEKLSEKLRLFTRSELLIYKAEIPGIEKHLADPVFSKLKKFSWSLEKPATLQVTSLQSENGGTNIQAIHEGRGQTIFIPFTDIASVENAISCWALLLYLGVPQEAAAVHFAQLAPVAMRLELKNGINGCSLINDSYNSDLGSLQIALDFLMHQQQHQRRTVILSDILQSGRDEKTLYAEVAALLAQKGVHRIIGIGEAIQRSADLFTATEKNFFQDTASFLRELPTLVFRNETILVKGARSFGFEDIIKNLQQQAHETVLSIRLDALVHNLNYFRSKLNPGTKLMAMVKAFSYGSGTFEIANTLQFHRVDYLAVAYADEGLALRRAGIRTPVMVMNPEEQGYETMIAHQLEPEIFSFRVLEKFEAAVQRFGDGKPYPVHLKFDTGMKRLGFEEKDIPQLLEKLNRHTLLQVQSVFSHLAASDETEHDAFTLQQVEQFKQMSSRIISGLGYPVMRHILNSAGIQRFPEAQFEMVRLGIGLYGIGANEKEQSQLKTVSALKTVISQIKHVPQGETVGYSRKGKTLRDTTTATVPIGYADGLSRRLSNGKGKMWINGKAAPIIGNVCMDMTMLDITGIPCSEGDEVIIFDEDHPITDFARDMDTIAYEALTMVSGRVKRVYEQE